MKLKRLAFAGVGGVGATYVGAQAVGLLSRMGPPSAVTANAAMIGGPLLLGWFLGKRRSAMLKDVGTGMAVQGATTAGLLLLNRFAPGAGN
jgi:hypothetical protein